MLINLITVWKKNVLPGVLNENKEIKVSIVAQSSFQFDVPPRVIFFKDIHARNNAADYYGDLPTVQLQSEEQKVYEQTEAQLRKKNPNFYNGKQMLLTGAIYSTSFNRLYLEAVRVDYVFLEALEKMKAVNAEGSHLHDKHFFKTGVMTPFISKDDKISIITRKDKWNLRSVAGGFLECNGEQHPLANLIIETALKEANEEFLHDSNGHTRLELNGLPTIASISFRDATGFTPTLEFIAPIQLKQDADFVLSVLNNNEAPHAYEHVPKSAQSVPLAANERETANYFINPKNPDINPTPPGSFLYGPVVHACAARVNQGMTFAQRIEGVPTSRFYPIGIFKQTPQKVLQNNSRTIMPIVFQDISTDIEFQYHDQLPEKAVNLRIKGEPTYKVNVSALHLYSLYRNSVYDSYRKKADLALDIKKRESEYKEEKESSLSQNTLYKSPVYHYSVAASLEAMKEWKESNGKMKCFIAYQNQNGQRATIGFVHFTEQTVNNKKVVYVAQAGVEDRSQGQGIGRHLIECVLAHYPAGTEFYILTRVFNTEAKNLYQKRLLFKPIKDHEIQQLGYDKQYCGFKRKTNIEEIDDIKNRQLLSTPFSSQLTMR